jgi:TonB-linked SusC/RagA family outer membrane protein
MRKSNFFFKTLFLLFFLLVLGGNLCNAQDVRGAVTDQDDNPLLGVNVIVTGTSTGTITDFDGKYSITLTQGAKSLTFSYIGYNEQTVSIDGRSQIDVSLQEDVQSLDEVVLTGYSTKQRRDVTSAIASVDIDSYEKRAVTNSTQALQGTVAGVNIISNGGNPGSGVNINIRGISSYGGNNQPLVVIDGVQTSSGLDNVNMNDVASIQVLKDASAAAIYGSRGANGVILVQSKKGKLGKTTFTYSSYGGVQIPRKAFDLANTQEYVTILQRMHGTALADPLLPQAARDYLNNPSGFGEYDWQNLIYRSANLQNHDLAVSGGTDKASFRVSAGYLDQKGVTLGTAFNRVNLRANGSFHINDHIRLGSSIALFRSKKDPEANAFSRSLLQQAIKIKPYFAPTFEGSGVANPSFPDTNPDSDIQTSSVYFDGGDNPEAYIRNPNHFRTLWDQDIIEDEVSVNLYAEFDLLKGLTYKISGSYSILNSENNYYFGNKGSNQDEYFDQNNTIYQEFSRNSNWNVDNTLRYSTTINEKHDLDILGGYVAQKFEEKSMLATQSNYLADPLSGINTLSAPGGQNPYIGGSRSYSSLVSYVAQISYAFDHKYLISGNYRRDGSSRFSSDVRWGDFGGGSIGWRVSNEAFWKNSGFAKVINEFKLRAGYGVLGRQNIGDFDVIPVLNYENVVFGENINNGLITGTAINTLATWEKLKSTNIGVDFGLFNKLSGSFEYYDSTTSDMIIAQAIAPSVGGGTLNVNNGEIVNSGLEITLNYNDKIGDNFTYNLGFNLGTQNAKITKLGTDLIIPGYGEIGPEWDVPHVYEIHEGNGVSEYWVIKTDGLFRSDAEVLAHTSSDGTVIQPDAQPGDIRFIDSNDDGEISSEGDRILAGSGIPNINAGFNLSARYKNIDFSLNLTGAFGHQVYNAHRYLVSKTQDYGNFGAELLNSYDPITNPNSNIPRLNPNDVDENWNARPQSDRFIEKGDYVKVRNLELGFSLPKTLTDKWSMEKARLFVRGQNILTITGYQGVDPEIGESPILASFAGPFTQGLDRDTAPQVASVQLGLSITF